MNSLITLSYSSLTTPRLSFPTRRRSRRPRRTPLRHNPCTTSDTNRANPLSKPTSLDYESINLVVDFNQISILSSSKSRFDQFVSSAEDAYYDLRSVVSVDHNGRLVVSCRRSTLRFVGTLLASGFVLLFVFKVLARLGLGLRARFGAAKRSVVVRRDRSLGGKEVVVGTRDDEWSRSFNRPLDNPLSLGRETGSGSSGRVRSGFRVKAEDKLPKWWPVTMASEQTLVADKEEYQREATRLIQAIIDRRTSGQDVMADDIIQLRRLCRTSGVRVSIDTINTRDSLYRTSVDFVLNVCSWELSQSASVQIGGEDARQFVAGLAGNIGLENIRAARMVSAAVAARTRSCFLQAWALEMQGNHFEAVSELGKICRVLRIFPPEESSPEMEMVARGLEKLLKVEQREHLMNMLVGVCSEEIQGSAAEALGLALSAEGNRDHQH